MRKIGFISAIIASAALIGCSKEVANLEVSFPDKFEGERAELAMYDDTTHIQSIDITNGKAIFELSADTFDMPAIVQVIVNSRPYGYAIIESGNIILTDSTRIGRGTGLNDAFARFSASADSIDATGNQAAYRNFLREKYESNKDNPIGLYAAVELSRWLEKPDIDAILSTAPEHIRQSHRIARYNHAAELRASTTPGHRFIDFKATQPDGHALSLSDFAGKGDYVIVDFWASWCPYCIKELPELKQIQQKFADKNVKIVGVAVRDTAEDTKDAVTKHGITWDIMYNTQRIPYDIYGFTGIPHLMLISPDGTIISRGETPAEISSRLDSLVK